MAKQPTRLIVVASYRGGGGLNLPLAMQFGNLFLLGLGADGEPLSRHVLFHALPMETDIKKLVLAGHSREKYLIFSPDLMTPPGYFLSKTGGEGGIRTHGPGLPGQAISSRSRSATLAPLRFEQIIAAEAAPTFCTRLPRPFSFGKNPSTGWSFPRPAGRLPRSADG